MRSLTVSAFSRAAGDARRSLVAGLGLAWTETRKLLALDAVAIVLLALALGPFLASVARHADNALLLSAMVDDDALISLQLDGMTAWPWGNPANYLGPHGAPGLLPPHWHHLSYQGLPYYGGLYLDLAFLLWVPLKLLGLPFFPVGPIILRVLALLFTGCTLLAGYNLARLHFGKLAGCLTGLLFASEYELFMIGTSIHPDSLLFFTTLVTLQLCIVHAQRRSAASVVAIGIAAGLVQGAKMGGPALVPVTVVALALGARGLLRAAGWPAWMRAVLRDGLLAAVVALAVFFLTTPYALLDSYFLETWLHWAKVFTGTSPISPTTFQDWVRDAVGYVGRPTLLLAAVGAVVPWLLRAGRERWLPLLLALVLGATVFVYYAAFQKYWVQLQYLVVPYWLLTLLGGLGLALVAQALSGRIPALRLPAAGIAFAGVLALFLVRAQSQLFLAFEYMAWKESPQYRIGLWAGQHLPAGGAAPTVITDGPTYFPPGAVRHYMFLGGPVRYQDLAERLPDFFLLTRYRSNWQPAKIAGAVLDPWDPASINLRLYQDLLGTSATEVALDRSLPFATRVHSEGWVHPDDGQGVCRGQTLDCAPFTPARIAFLWEQAHRALAYSRHVSLFRLDKEKFLEMAPPGKRLLAARPFASGTADDSKLDFVMTGGNNWRSPKQGPAADGEYVGFELPAGARFQPRELTVRWVAWHWVPRSFALEGSDDGRHWTPVASLHPKEPPDVKTRMNGTNRWDETFPVPAGAGAHRWWRLRAEDVPEGQYFGLERISAR